MSITPEVLAEWIVRTSASAHPHEKFSTTIAAALMPLVRAAEVMVSSTDYLDVIEHLAALRAALAEIEKGGEADA